MFKSDRVVVTGLAGLAAVAAVLAHPDDPKQWEIDTPYVGAAYRSGQGDALPAGTDFIAVGVDLLAWLPLGEFGPEHFLANDCWGYVSPSGREYAIVGLSHGTGFVEITDPGNPVIVDVVPGPSGNIWRDIKVYQHHAYAVSEDGGGVQAISMTDIDNGNVGPASFVTLGGVTESTHNVALNEDSGYLYRCGGAFHGLRIYDLTDPANPVFVTSWDDKYVHDAQIVSFTSGPWAGREIAFCCAGFNGGGTETGLTILDVTNKTNIFEMGPHLLYPNGAYSHQGWLSPDRQYFYLNDEQDQFFGLNSTTLTIDVSDLTAPFFAASYANGSPTITHNLYTRGDLIFAANYTSGLRVLDASDPLNLSEIAFFDTNADNESVSFQNLWSNYPNFPSGTIIGSDREKGLLIWQLGTIPLAFSYPDGLPDMLDAQGESIGVQITEVEEDPLDPSTAMLHYDDGSGMVDVPLTPAGGSLFNAEFPDLGCGSNVSYYFSAQTVGGALVNDPPAAPSLTHDALVANAILVALNDDFETDLGWTSINAGASDGDWERGVPVNDPGNPDDPISDADGSGQCWMTSNQTGESDVDGGQVQLRSPEFDMSAGNIGISYEYFTRLDVANGFDGLRVQLSNSGAAGPYQQLTAHTLDGGLDWHHAEFLPADIVAETGLTMTPNMVFRFTAADGNPQSIVEVALDAFQLLEVQCDVFGDLDGDGIVGITDFLALLAAWGPCPNPCPPSCAADLDGDCDVGITDFLGLLANWS